MRHLLVLALATSFALGEYCPPHIGARIQECVAPVADYARVLNGKESDLASPFALPNMGGRVFNELCKLIAKFNACVGDYRNRCGRHVTISLIDSSYGYLCNEGYNTFMESAECLMELDRREEVKTCHDVTLQEIEDANASGGIALPAKMDRMCGALNYFSGCVRSPIRRECGASAWQVIYRVLKDTTNTLMPACQFTGTSPRLSTTASPSSSASSVVTTTEMTSTTPMKISTSRRDPVENIATSVTEPSTRKTMRKNISPLTQTTKNTAATMVGGVALTLLLSIAF